MNTVSQLPRFILDLMAAAPRHGEGVHSYLFRLSRLLHRYRSESEIIATLCALTADCGRVVPENEIIEAVRNSLPHAWQSHDQSAPITTAPKWPKVNQEQREAVIRDGGGLVDLWELSRTRIDDNESHTEQIVDQLFPGNPLLCCGVSQLHFDTKERESWRGKLKRQQFIVPSPMSSVKGNTKQGRASKHTLQNTGPRRFLICEFDAGSVDDHAALVIHLAGYAPLVCAVHSGGKSLHGWFYVHNQPEKTVMRFFRYAVSLGADPATWTPSQFVRIPDGIRRNNGKRQTVFFLNFKPVEVTQ
jgi:hypothetical protein